MPETRVVAAIILSIICFLSFVSAQQQQLRPTEGPDRWHDNNQYGVEHGQQPPPQPSHHHPNVTGVRKARRDWRRPPQHFPHHNGAPQGHGHGHGQRRNVNVVPHRRGRRGQRCRGGRPPHQWPKHNVNQVPHGQQPSPRQPLHHNQNGLQPRQQPPHGQQPPLHPNQNSLLPRQQPPQHGQQLSNHNVPQVPHGQQPPPQQHPHQPQSVVPHEQQPPPQQPHQPQSVVPHGQPPPPPQQLPQGFNNTSLHPLALEFLVAHNKARKDYNLTLYTWDVKLESYARQWAISRSSECTIVHSGEPGMYGKRPYGENMYWSLYEHSPTKMVNSFLSEQKYYDFETNSCVPGQGCGHFTQIIWRDSLRLGCWRQKCNKRGYITVCEYDPKGNYLNEKPLEAHNV